jgi:hypothetical protein
VHLQARRPAQRWTAGCLVPCQVRRSAQRPDEVVVRRRLAGMQTICEQARQEMKDTKGGSGFEVGICSDAPRLARARSLSDTCGL